MTVEREDNKTDITNQKMCWPAGHGQLGVFCIGNVQQVINNKFLDSHPPQVQAGHTEAESGAVKEEQNNRSN